MAGEATTLVADATPYMTAAVSAYADAVLAKVRDDAADATAGLGRGVLQRVFGHRHENEALPEPLTVLAADPDDQDVRAMWAASPNTSITQHIHAGRDTYIAGRDQSTVNYRSRDERAR
jgi:hypothetical protein